MNQEKINSIKFKIVVETEYKREFHTYGYDLKNVIINGKQYHKAMLEKYDK